jgi:hypothetical protein
MFDFGFSKKDDRFTERLILRIKLFAIAALVTGGAVIVFLATKK